MIRVVTPDVPVRWLLDDEELAPSTEFLAADGQGIGGWCNVEDLVDASGSGVTTVGEMDLRPCEVSTDEGPGVSVRCGQFALIIDDVALPTFARRDRLSIGWPTLFGGGWLAVSDISSREFFGPLPDPQPVKLARGCLYPSCGFFVYLPPNPSPCPNRNLPTHDFA